jgi:hypothetical protein
VIFTNLANGQPAPNNATSELILLLAPQGLLEALDGGLTAPKHEVG